jgi:solute:Na+ symporter, SSS family
MQILEVSTFLIYFFVLLIFIFLSSKKQKSDTQFVLGNRSLSFWLTALSAHASEMGNWLFMGYPLLIFTTGVFGAWAAIGLVVFMFLNWQFVAPKIRELTGKYDCLTLNEYFEKRFNDTTSVIRTISAIISLIFFMVYISAGLVGLGFIVETLFNINYLIGIFIGFFIVVLYVLMGGYNTVAWIDLIQGFFLLFVIVFIPIYLIPKLGGMAPILTSINAQKLTTSLLPSFSFKKTVEIIFISCGWGLGYFGQPHIITKFMGIKNVNDMGKAKCLGISWQISTLTAATFIGLIAIFLFPNGVANPQLVSLEIVRQTLIPLFSGLVMCAILAAATNVMAAQLLVVSSSMAEDLYKKFINKESSHLELLKVNRLCVILVAIFSFIIAYFRPTTIYQLVLYSWSGLGAAFGPLLLISLYSKKITRTGAIVGIFTGGIIAGIWPLIDSHIEYIDVPPLIPAFLLSALSIFAFSGIYRKK